MRIRLFITVMATIVAGLSACQTMTPEERRAADEQRCLSYGFRRGTDGFATCLQRIDLDRRAESRAQSAEMMNNMAWELNGPYIYRDRWRHHH
ncbi:hypothetical protein EHI47_15895 [Rhizobium leguminosarum]|uniref:Lipoprotein n=1 Tax=Rhizobium leguminosarum TaxID=384 RepID=A0A444HZS6_RHILE|nr:MULTISPECIES: hypothetical protein [Rhizobium]RWX30021.1 hypothetical protein EHI47_15895 [Rhizobium leguminosarum]TBC93170.1 hypothetical protein ELH26_03530 [Rhizobium leguminosarum]WSG75192.1 hypothetical protein U8P80_05540 [Rhizobium beringeri]WSH15387.1 hypothetical protein U8P74_05540 [Rhizobium beringeri]WSH52098.1 hypothetical protein U8Q06_05475 [Rhizobium beringeri]